LRLGETLRLPEAEGRGAITRSDTASSSPDPCQRESSPVRASKVLLVENPDVLTPKERAVTEEFQKQGGKVVASDSPAWLDAVKKTVRQFSVTVEGPPTVRAYVADQPKRTIVHVLNLNVRRLSSFEDEVRPATNIRIRLVVPFAPKSWATCVTADAGSTRGHLPLAVRREQNATIVELTIPRLEVASMLFVEP
jgi:hypothetical protein